MSESKSPLKPGNNVMIRCVTHYYIGKIVEVGPQEVVLEDACWIADAGRWGNALATEEKGLKDVKKDKIGVEALKEIEPFPDGPVAVGRAAIVDVCLWAHELPREQKSP